MTWNWHGNAGAMPLGRNGSNASTSGGYIAPDNPTDNSVGDVEDQEPTPPTEDPTTDSTSPT